jgi:hypothetical protein
MKTRTLCHLFLVSIVMLFAYAAPTMAQQSASAPPSDEKSCTAAGGQCTFGGCDKGEQQNGSCNDKEQTTTCCVPKKEGAPAAGADTGAVANAPVVGSTTKLYDPLGGIGIVGIVSRLIKTFLGVAGGIALLVFVYAGIMYMTAGSSDRIKKSVDAMKYAAIGLFILMFAYMITSLYLNVLTSTAASKTTKPAATSTQ